MTRLLIPVLLCVLAATACRQPQPNVGTAAEKPFISPPVNGLETAFEEFEFDACKAQMLVARHATITIPANTIKTSTPCAKVKLRFRSYQDAADIWLSGIPMRYDSAGVRHTLSTAGMFEIRAEENGKPVSIDKGNKINIKLASATAGNDYGVYYLDEDKRNWAYLSTSTPEVNRQKQVLRDKINKTALPQAFPLDDKYFAVNYYQILDVLTNDRPHTADSAAVARKLKAYGLGFLNTYTFQSVKFAGLSIPAMMIVWKRSPQTPLPKWKEEGECRVKPLGGNWFELTLYKDYLWRKPSDSVKVKAEAIMTLSEMFKFTPEYWASQYDAALRKLEIERERLRSMAEVYRSVEVEGWGIYNFDRILKEPDALTLAATFDFGEYDRNLSDVDEVVFIPSDNRSVIKLEKNIWANMPLAPDKGGRLFALLPDKRLLMYDVPRYAAIEFDKLRSMSKPAMSFDMKADSRSFSTVYDIRQFLGIDEALSSNTKSSLSDKKGSL